jgi:alkylhydroperoxidase/carboxymuconolactone decarboxylase family protein YurZ
MGVIVNTNGIVKYLTGNKISEVLQSVAKACHADLTKDEIGRLIQTLFARHVNPSAKASCS